MQTAKPHLELLTCEAAYRHNPTALFHQVCGARPATLLLESADIDSKDDLKACCWLTARCALPRRVTPSPLRRYLRMARRCCRCWMRLCLQVLKMSVIRTCEFCISHR